MRSRLLRSLAVLWLAAVASACGAIEDGIEEGMRSASPSAKESANPSEPESGSESSSPSERGSTPAASPSPTKPPSAAGSPVADELTGFGATVEAWEKQNGDSVEGYTEGSVYGPIVRDGGVHKYFGVMAEDRVYLYSRGFPEGTNLQGAERSVLQDFPSDARITVRDDDEPGCLILLIRSRTVREVLQSDAMVAFFSAGDRLNRNDISDSTVSITDERGPDLGFC